MIKERKPKKTRSKAISDFSNWKVSFVGEPPSLAPFLKLVMEKRGLFFGLNGKLYKRIEQSDSETPVPEPPESY